MLIPESKLPALIRGYRQLTNIDKLCDHKIMIVITYL